MEYIVTFALAIASIFGAIIVGLCKDEASAWLPSLIRLIVSVAIKRAPNHMQAQCAEEWSSHVAEYPGKLSQIAQALLCVVAAGGLKPWSINRFARYSIYFFRTGNICVGLFIVGVSLRWIYQLEVFKSAIGISLLVVFCVFAVLHEKFYRFLLGRAKVDLSAE